MLILSDSIELNNKVQIACLPKQQSSAYPSDNNTIYVAGWGANEYGGPISKILYNVKLRIYEKSYCEMESLIGYEKDFSSQICAGELDGSKDTCQGDSGSPIFLLDDVNNQNKFVFVGIVSYGYKCAVPNNLG
jgi:secreted trypsin-like serine protease